MSAYNVVFVYTKSAGHFAGIRTWTSYKSKEDFQKQYKAKETEVILAEGVSEKECVKQTRSTDPLFRLAAAIGKSITGEIPSIDYDIFKFELFNLEMSLEEILRR